MRTTALDGRKRTWLQSCGALYVFIVLSCSVMIGTSCLAAEIDFESQIAPIFEERCWFCHGEDEQESGLRLDLRAHMLKGGDSGLAAIVPGKPEKSYLIDVVKHLDPDAKMPPDEDQIPKAEIQLLENWIQQGAVWPGQMDTKLEESI
ncbi:MAG: c-type cytochrome domain-containing protein, partial [Planctomycetota bacterium]